MNLGLKGKASIPWPLDPTDWPGATPCGRGLAEPTPGDSRVEIRYRRGSDGHTFTMVRRGWFSGRAKGPAARRQSSEGR